MGGLVTLSPQDVRKIIFGAGPVQRFTQDSPVLSDVWIAYAENPDQRHDLLITPYQASFTSNAQTSGSGPGRLARILEERLKQERRTERWKRWASRRRGSFEIAYNMSTVAARLRFDELVRV